MGDGPDDGVLHWPVPADALRPLVPEALELDLFDGQAWLGITPLVLHDFRPRGLPALPALSSFPELNFRTYVRARGRPGIHFFSLDAGSSMAVAGARTFFRLPYHRADMTVDERDGRIEFASRRAGGDARFHATYRPTDLAADPEPGSLAHFLVERYALFTILRGGKIPQTEVHHRPWPLQPAEAEVTENSLAAAHDLPGPGETTLLHFSRRQDTLVWGPTLMD